MPQHPWSVFNVASLRTPKILSQYFAACSGVDRGVGRIVSRLDKLKLSENTLVIYTSDQGFCCGHHGLWAKGNASNPRNIYDTSLQVPLIAWQPGRIKAGAISDALFASYDLVPTVLEYLGLPPSPARNLPGHSFAPLLRNEAFDPPTAVFAEYGRARMIRTADWKLIHRADGGPHELYDLVNDPAEEKNLADVPEYRPQLKKLRQCIFDWFDRYAEAGRDPVGNEYLRPADK